MILIYFLLAILFVRFILLLPIYGEDKVNTPEPKEEESFYQRYLRQKEANQIINQVLQNDKVKEN